MSTQRLTIRLLLMLALYLGLGMPVPAQEAGVAPPTGPAPVSQTELDTQRDSLNQSIARIRSLAEAVDTAPAEAWLRTSPEQRLSQRAGDGELSETERTLWQTALEQERSAVERLRGALDRAGIAKAATDRLQEARQRLDQSLRQPYSPGEDRSISQIEDDIGLLERRREQTALELDQRRVTLSRLEEQSRTQAETLERLQHQRTEELEALPPTPEDAELSNAVEAARHAITRRADARIIAAQLDGQSLTPRIEVLRLEIPALELELRWLRAGLAELERELGERSSEELRTLQQGLQRLVEREPEARTRFAGEIQALRVRFDRIAETQARVRTLQQERDRYVRIERELTQTLANVRERLEVGGLTEALGSLFLEEQRRLRDLEEARYAVRGIERELAQSRLRAITLREQLSTQPRAVILNGDDLGQGELRRLQEQALTIQLHAEDTLADQLRQTELRLRTVVVLVDELDQILRETLLWWPSHVPVGVDWSVRIPAATLALLDPTAWQEVYKVLWDVTVGSPIALGLTLLLALSLYVPGRRTPSHLEDLAARTRHRFTDSIKLTLQALGWSLLRVLPIPVLLMATSLRLEAIPEVGHGVEALATIFFSTSIWWLAGHLLILLTHKNGVGTAHFKWNPLMVRRLRRHLTWFLPTQLLLILLLALTFSHPSDQVFDVFGRMALLAAVVVSALFGWWLLSPFPEGEEPPLKERRRRMLRTVIGVAVLTLAGLTLAGYLLTVAELMSRSIDTLVIVGIVWLGYNLSARALILSETRLRVRRMREQRAKAATMESSSAGTGAEGGLDIPEPHLSMEDVNLQTRTLMRITVWAAVALALFWAWSDVLPALTWLDGITLWSRTIMVGEAEVLSRVSLLNFLMAIFLGVVFTLAARNLPGLVEILLSRSTQMDASGRYTVTMLLRYALTVVAIISVFSLLGLRWSELQWMVAALTLGLGFGLQEVVANFVSGLIMLFERPVRVGDTITIGEYSGTVARIRTRATTIVDWDNREVVIPNKNFITERLINWTLSDTVTRLVIPVGVSYSADVDLVRETLLQIAAENPQVLKEPGPSVFFIHFGDSALNFELRVYVSQLRERLMTTSELHTTIIKRFRALGIEIAFPQMDLHIRDMVPAPGGPTQSPAAGQPPRARGAADMDPGLELPEPGPENPDSESSLGTEPGERSD
ncbi:mechanosensitive ion channel domain-containing protein [Ectothiorhodospira lacustris]|uniref:mechanosensitive ion channel domain-containing protein n=1 Tax=Ectothiorhodospira lacustris TaxID=2899127 RepID=UPI001EE8CA7C|nr:mechanosensitive ion channel domain-containing protein [Ectothiorhodospira lacustris]MCG5509013.1 mechanosensitive ion channel [Ectothiorhodospira lacustris]MCG5520804.1 mechanosensitive ion channel [Ectothiorhodospira lacustris]